MAKRDEPAHYHHQYERLNKQEHRHGQQSDHWPIHLLRFPSLLAAKYSLATLSGRFGGTQVRPAGNCSNAKVRKSGYLDRSNLTGATDEEAFRSENCQRHRGDKRVAGPYCPASLDSPLLPSLLSLCGFGFVASIRRRTSSSRV
jgi:hypothetical protein